MDQLADLKNLLRRKLGEDLEIVSHSLKNLTAPGDNYGSTMLSLNVQVKSKSTGEESTWDLVAKMGPRDPMLFQMFQVPTTFRKESLLYTDVAGELNRHQDEHNVPESLRMDAICECWGTRRNLTTDEDPLDSNAALVLENLKVQGFKCGERLKGFDQKDTEFVLRHLARFHALPIAVKMLKPEVFEEKIRPSLIRIDMEAGMPEEFKAEMERYIKSSIESIPEIQHLANILEVQLAAGRAFLNNNGTPRESRYNTICHRDFWMNNMMLKHDEDGNPERIRIVDFQMTCFETCVQDLIFFLFTTVNNEVLQRNLEHFLEFYFNEFHWSLRANGVSAEEFTFESFLAEVNEVAPYELSHILIMTKVLMIESKNLDKDAEAISMEEMSGDKLIGPAFYAKFKNSVLMFEKRGWIWKEGQRE